jgi:hypothetical protein
MTGSKDWVKQGHEEFYDQAGLTVVYINNTETRARIGLASTTMAGKWLDDIFFDSYNTFQVDFEEWRDPSSRSQRKIKKLNDSEEAFRPIYRQLYTSFLKTSPFVTDDDLLAMGMPPRSSGSHPSPVAKVAPEYSDDTSVHRQLGIHIKGAKPEGQHGVEVCWAILDAPPKSVTELVNSSFVTRSPLILKFEEEQRGKTVYFRMRWENTRGEKGPWSDVYNAIIP